MKKFKLFQRMPDDGDDDDDDGDAPIIEPPI